MWKHCQNLMWSMCSPSIWISFRNSIQQQFTRLCTWQAHQIRTFYSPESALTLSPSLVDNYCFHLSLTMLRITTVKHRDNTHKIDLRQSTQQSRIFTFKPNKLLELRSQGIVASSNAIEIALTKAQVIHRITERTKISGIAATSARQARDRRRNYSKMTNTLVCDSFKARKLLSWYLCHRPELSTELR